MIAPFGSAAARLDEIPGIGPVAAAIIIAEIGLDMTRFPPPPTWPPGRSSPPG
jgi:transposase